MGNKTFLHYLKCLAISAACFMLPANAIAQSYTDLVGNTLDGWTLYWGSYQSNKNNRGYDWVRTKGSGNDGVTSSLGAYSPTCDQWKYSTNSWPSAGKDVCAPRFYIETPNDRTTAFDPLYNATDMPNMNANCYMHVLPDDPDLYKSSFRLGSVSFSKDGQCQAAEYYKSAGSYGTSGSWASAEGASYDLFVTNDNALLTINYLFVSTTPDCGGSHSYDTYGAAAPEFDLKVMPQVGGKYSEQTKVQCGTADLDPCKVDGCKRTGGNFYRGLVNSGWKKSIYDLTPYIGNWVRILVRTHDCVFEGTNAGGHYSYCYFTARTRPVKLNIEYCKVNEPVKVTAPDGFDTYEWFGFNGDSEATKLTAYTNSRFINETSGASLPYDRIKCVMKINNLSCDIVLDTTFKPANLTPSISVVDKCNYKVNLTDNTFDNPNIKGDSAVVRIWNVFDKVKYPKTANINDLEAAFASMVIGQDYDQVPVSAGRSSRSVDTTLAPEGQWVRMYVKNTGNCEAYKWIFVQPNPVAKWGTVPLTVCENFPVKLTFTKDNAYNALYQTEAKTDVYRWSLYSNLSSDLKFTVTKNDGTTVTGITGQPLTMTDSASTEKIHYDYIVEDKFHCRYTGTYDIEVNQKPYLSLSDDLVPDSTDARGNLYFKICPGTTKEFSAYSTNADLFHWNNDASQNELGENRGGIYYSNTKQLGFGNYFVNVKNSTSLCESRIYLNVIYHYDSVKVNVPDEVCPFEPAVITAVNYNSAPSWWEVKDGSTEKTGQNSGAAYTIHHPDENSTYYCNAFDTHGCEYTKNFKLNVIETKNSSFSFLNMVTGRPIAPANVQTVNSHHYRLPKMCNTDELAITATSSEFSAKHAWKTNYAPTWVESDLQSASVTQGGFVPRANLDLQIIWRTIPIDGLGNELCIVYDTITVMGYPQIQSAVTVNGQTSGYHVCDQSDVNLAVTPNFYTQDGDRTKFTIQWTDINGGYNDDAVAFDETVKADIHNTVATNSGHIYTYTFRVTSNEGGCTQDFEVPVFINPLPDFTLTAQPEKLCVGGKEIVTATDMASGTYLAQDNPTVSSWEFPSPTDFTSPVTRTATSNSYTYTNITGDKLLNVTGITSRGCRTTKQINVSTAQVPALRVQLTDAYNNEVTSVCSGSKYKLVVFDDNNNKYQSCDNTQWVTVKRNSVPYDEITWQETNSGDIMRISNAVLKHTYNITGTSFGSYTARDVVAESTEYFDIFINSPCGCRDSIMKYPVTVNPAPRVTITASSPKDFLCPNTKMELTAKASKADPSNTFKYYWTISNTEIQPGNLDNATGGSNADKTKSANWTNEASSFFYNAQVFDGLCYGVAAVKIYNQQKPNFTISAEPAEMCSQGSNAVKLTASSTDPTADYTKYYLKNPTTGYATATPWINNERDIDNVRTAVDASNKMFVRAGVARLVKSDVIRVDDENYYCYDTIEVPIDVKNNPVVNVVVKRADNTVVDLTNDKLCPGEKYSIIVNNTRAVDSEKYKIEIVDANNSTRSYDKSVFGNLAVTFATDEMTASSDRPSDRWKVKITPTSSTSCASETVVNIPISEAPVIKIAQEGGRPVGKDTVAFCVNYYQLAQSNNGLNKTNVRTAGVDLTADIDNERPGYTYSYVWKKTVNGAAATVTNPNNKQVNASVDATTTASSYVHTATYTVTVTDNYTCSSSKSIVVKANDAPRPYTAWTDAPGNKGHQVLFYNACQNSETNVWVYEEERNMHVTDAVIPSYNYNVYDLNNQAGYSLAQYDQYGYGLKLEDLTEVNPGFDSWSTYRNSGLGSLKNKAGVVVPDSVTYLTLRKKVSLPIGTNEETLYMVSVADSLGCTGYLTINYNPHEYVNLDKFFFKVSVNQGGAENTPKMKKFLAAGALDNNGNDTVAYVCPGDYIVFDFADMTEYASKYLKNNPWQYNPNFRVAVEFANVDTRTSGFSTAEDTTKAFTYSTGRTISGPQRFRLRIDRNSDGHGQCPIYSPYFWISIADAPNLLQFGDNACRLDQDGNPDGLIKFRAASNAPTNSTHHYTWWASDNQTQLQNGVDGFTISGDDGELLTYQTNFRKEDFGTGSNKAVSVYLRDEVEGFCRSADLKITRYVYNNPEFAITTDKDYVCEGGQVTFRVTQDFNWTRSGWHSYANNNLNSTQYDCQMYNDNALRSSCGSPTTFPHYYEKTYNVNKGNDTINVTAFYSTGTTMTYDNHSGSTRYLYCYTHNNYVVHALNNPDPYVRLKATDDEGNYHKDEIILSASKASPDSVGSRMICPDDEYYRQFSNANPDTLNGYKQTNTSYYIKKSTDAVYVPYTRVSTQVITDKDGYTAADEYYDFYAETDNGCKSDPIQFHIPVATTPQITLRKAKDGVCADNKNNTIQLTASAPGATAYKWYINNINPANLQNSAPYNESQIDLKPVPTTPTPYHKDLVTYYVEVENQHACKSSASTTVALYPIPQFDLKLLSDKPCENSTVKLGMQKSNGETNYDENTIFTYSWTGGANIGTDENKTVVETPEETISGASKTFDITATVWPTNNVSCSASKTIEVSTSKIPAPDVHIFAAEKTGLYNKDEVIASGAKLCPGAKYYLTFTNSATAADCEPDRYELINTANVNDTIRYTSTGSGIPFTTAAMELTGSVNYRYRLVSGCDCVSEWKPFSLEMVGNATITIDGPNGGNFCEGTDERMTLTASAGTFTQNMRSWEWSPVVTDNNKTRSQTFVPTQDRTFTVTGETEYGCPAVGSYTIKMQKRPNLIQDGTIKPVCAGSDVELKVKNTNEQVDAVMFQWTASNGQTWTTTEGDNTSKIKPTIGETTSFDVYAKANNSLQCASRPITVNVVAAVKPEVEVHYYANGVEFDPAIKALCPGTQFYPVFKNKKANANVCTTDEFEFWEEGSAAEHFKASPSAGTSANSNGAFNFTMGETSANYSYKAKTSCGCEADMGTFTVAVAAVPVVKIVGENTYCENETPAIKLKAQSAANITTWLWSANVTTATDPTEQATDRAKDEVTVSPNAKSTTYTLVGTSNDGCTSLPDKFVITQKEVPTISFESTPYVCPGSPVTVKSNFAMPDGADVLSTVWSPIDASKLADDEVTYNITEATSFQVTLNTTNGCQVISEPYVVKPYKTPAANLTLKIAADFGKYEAGDVITSGTALCKGATFFPSFVNAETESDDSYCEADTIFLTCRTTGETYKFHAKSGSVINNGANRKVFTMVDQDLSFSYQLRTSCGCYSPKANFTVRLADAPNVRILANKQDFCDGAGDEITLTATAGSELDSKMTWNWTTCPTSAITKAVQKFSPTATATYIVSGKSADGCAGTAEITISKLDVPVISLAANPGLKVCYGTRVELTATNENENNAPLSSVAWTSDNGHNLSGVTVPFTSNATTTFTAVATAENGCKVTSDPITVTMAQTPNPIATLYRADGSLINGGKLCEGDIFYAEFKNLTGNSDICENDVYSIANSDSTKFYSATATGGGVANQGGDLFKFEMGKTSQVYNYKVKTTCGCESKTSSFMVGVAQNPVVTISGINEYCNNTTPSISLTANSSAEIKSYEWSSLVQESQRANKTVNVTPVGTQTFTVVATSKEGCQSEAASHTITAKQAPLAVLKGEKEVCLGSQVGVKADITLPTGSTLNNTIWSPATGITRVTEDSVYATINAATTFNVTVNASNGCSVTTEDIVVAPIEHPTASVKLYYYEGPKKDVEFGPDTTELCNGTRFYPVFKNNVSVASCSIDTFIVRQGANEEKFITPAGSEANSNAQKFYTVDGGTTYFYSVKTSCGCESDEIKSYSIKVANNPTITIVADGLKGAKGDQYCEGDNSTVTLTASSSLPNTSFVWSNPIPAADAKKATVTVAKGSNSYTVTGTTAAGCSSEQTFVMVELPKPSVTIEGPAQACEGSKVTLMAKTTDGNTFLWNNGQAGATINPTIDNSTSFNVVTYSKDGCESDPFSIDITAIQNPVIDFAYNGINNSAFVCDGKQITVTASALNGAATFTWYTDASRTNELTVGDNITAINDGTVTVKPITNAPTNLYVTANLDGCISKDNAQVKAYPNPKISTLGKKTYCAGQDLKLSILNPDATTKYYWDASTDASESYELENVTPSLKNVSVLAVDANTCESTLDVAITVNEAPNISISADPEAVCPETSTVLTAAGADSYSWYVKGKNDVRLSTNAVYTTQRLTESTTYRVVGVKSNTQCFDSSFVTIDVKKAPSLRLITAIVNDSVPVCNGEEAILQVMGADSYTWPASVESSNGASATVKPTYSRSYVVTGEIDGCEATLDIPVRLLDRPIVVLSSNAANDGVCSGEEVTLTATVNNSTSQVAGMTYSWSDAPKETAYEHTTTITGDQTFTLTVRQGECVGQATKTITAYPIPFADITSDLNTVCQDSIVTLTAKVESGTPKYTYKWTRSTSDQKYTSETITPNITAASEDFQLTVIDAYGCTSSPATKAVFSQKRTTIKNIAPTTFCEGAERDSVRLNMSGAVEYRYMNGANWTATKDTVFYRATAGSFYLPVVGRVQLAGTTDRYCQTEVLNVEENIVSAPKVEMYVKDLQGDGVCSGTAVTLHVNSSLPADQCTFSWEGDKTGNKTNEYTEDALTEARTFICTVTDKSSQCSASASYFVDVYETPIPKVGYVRNPVCQGSTGYFEVNATSGTTSEFTYVWTRVSDPDYKATTANIRPVLYEADTFLVVVKDADHGCASQVQKVPVQVQSLPTVINSAKNQYCSTDSVRLVLSGASIYYVNNVQISRSDTAMLLPAGTAHFVVYGKVPRGSSSNEYCTSPLLMVDDTISNGPSVTIDGTQTVCQGTALSLDAKVNNYKDPSTLDYYWSEDQDEKTSHLSTFISSPRTITVRVTDPKTGCYGVDEKLYSVWDNPKAYVEIPEGDIVCNGELALLEARVEPQSDAYTYRWTRASNSSYIETLSQITPNVTEQETFYLDVTDLHGCASKQVSQIIKVVDKPTVKVLGADKPLCQDTLLTLTLSGADHYIVNNEELMTNIYTEKMTSARTAYYSVVGYNVLSNGAQCFSGETLVPVEVKDNPTLAIAGNLNICDGSPLSVTVSGADSYEWNTGATGETLELTPSGSVDGKYYYSVTGKYAESGCKSIKNIVVNTLKAPSFSIVPSAQGVCTDQEVDLTAVPDNGQTNTELWNYLWEGGRLTGATGANVSTLVTGGNTFTATATNEAGCSNKQSVTILQYAIPEIMITASADTDSYKSQVVVDPLVPLQLCENTQLKLFAEPKAGTTGITSYIWDDNQNALGQIYYPGDSVRNKLTYQHTVIGTTANGCKASAQVNVEIAKAPVVAIRADQAACFDQDITLYATGGSRYVWPDFNNATGNSYTTPATTLGVNTYTLYGYSEQGCRGEATWEVTVFQNPQFSLDVEGAYVCEGEKAYVGVVPDNDLSDYSYSWSNGSNTQNITPAQRRAGTYPYTVTVEDKATGCSLANTIQVTFFEKPRLSLASGAENRVCRGSDLVLVGLGANEYYWQVGTQEYGPYYNDQTFTSAPTVSQTYKMYGNNVYDNPVNGEQIVCSSSMDYPIEVVNAPAIQILGSSTICYGENVKLSATGIDLEEVGEKEPYYYWENNKTYGETFEDAFTADNGAEVVYTVRGMSANGCEATKTKVVTMRPKTVINITAPSPVCEGAVATAKVTGDNITSYRWNTNEMGDSIAHVITGNTTYSVTATDENDCKVTESVDIVMQEKLELVDETENGIHEVCAGSNIALKVSGASTYMWNKNPEKTSSVIILAPLTDTIYTVEGVYGVCKASLSIPVHAIPAPAVSIQGDGNVCSGDAIKLAPFSDTKDVTFTWTAAAEFEVDDATSVATVKPIVDTKVSLTGRSQEGCASTATTTITVNNLPTLDIDGDLAPCENSYTDLTASGALSYLWTVGTTKVNATELSQLVGSDPVEVTLWGIDANNCHNEIKTTLTPTKRPTFRVEGDTAVCLNSALQLQAVNDETACTYVWNGKDTVNIYNEVMAKAGTQTIPVKATLSSKPGCSTTKRVTVVVKELPQLYITGNNYPCQNSTMEVAAHGAEKYIWSNNPGDTLYDADGACIYSREVTTPAPFSAQLSGWKNGCRKDSVFTFQVHSSPLVTINADSDEACADGVVTLTATSPDATTFDWGADGAGATITPVITATKTFNVSVIDKFGCVGTDNYTISLISSPTLKVFVSEDYNAAQEIGEDGLVTVCSGNDLKFTARGAKTWSWVNGLESSDSASYIPAGTTTSQRIMLKGYLGSCEASQVITVTVLQKPDPWIDGQMNVCEGDIVNLVAMGADHYEWSGVSGVSGEKKDTLNYQLLYQPVEGNLKAIAANGCYTNVPFTLTYTRAPELNVDTKNDICVGAPLEMSVINPEDDVVYVWNDNFSGESFTFRSTTPGVSDVKVEAKVRGIGGCTTVKTLPITTHDLPVITFSADGDNVTVNADSTISMCAGSDLILVPLGAKHYNWKAEGLDSMANTMVLRPVSSSVYSITGTDEYGCQNDRDIVVKTNASPVLYSTTYGVPDANGRINVSVCRDDEITLDIAGADSYSWFDGSNGKQVSVTPSYTRTYSVSGMKSSTNCPASIEYHVTVNELPDVAIADNQGNTNRVSLCRDTKFTLKGAGATSYIWTDDQDNVISRKDSIVDYAGESEYYTLVGTDSNKCVNKAVFNIKAIEVPTISYEPLDPQVCAGARTTLYGRSTDANSWYWLLDNDTVSTKSSLTITPTADANYTLYGRNKYGCETSVDVPLTVFSSPTIWVDGYQTVNGVSDTIDVCKYQKLTLNMMGDAESYEWPSGSTERSITIESASMSQNYQVTGIGANNCKTTITIPVNVIPTALIKIEGDQYVCYGQSTVLKAVADAADYDNYVWSNNMIGTENEVYIFNDSIISVTGYNSTTGCSNTVKFPIIKKDLPVLGFQGETTICKGASSVIYATGANSYIWQDGTEGDAYVSTPTTNDIYKVIGILDGCADSLSIPIQVKVAPVIWADGLKPICQGEALALLAQGAETYEWSDGTTTAEFSAKPLEDVTYTLTGTAENGCSTTIQVPVTVRHRPVVTIDGNTNVCLNSTTDLKAVISSSSTVDDGTGNKYRWFHNDDVISTQNVLNYVITEGKTTFKLEGIDPAGCSNTTTFTVTSMALPELSYTGPAEICRGTSGTFYATGAKEYQWINGKDTVVGNVFKTSPETDTYYTLIGKSAMGCTSDTVVFLQINQLPEVTVAGNTSVCRGEALDLTGAGAVTYLWSNGTTTADFHATPVASSEYQLTGTDANGCSNTAKFKVTVNELPKFQVRAVKEGVCQGTMDTLYTINDDKESEYTYFWATDDGTNLSGDTISPVIGSKTKVVFTVTANNDATHCQSSVTKTVYSYDIPEIFIDGIDSICSGGSLSLTAGGADSYTWENRGEIISTKPNVTLSNVRMSTELYVTGTLASCSATVPYPINVVPNPVASIAEVNGRDYFCQGEDVNLIGSGLGKEGIYKWFVSDVENKVDTAITTKFTHTPSHSEKYSLIVINSFGCSDTTVKMLSIKTLPTVRINDHGKNYVCPNQIDSVRLDAVNTTYQRDVAWTWSSVPGNQDILENDNTNGFTAIFDTTTTVYLVGTDTFGCAGVDSMVVRLLPQTPMKFNVSPGCIDNKNSQVRFAGINPDPYENAKWTWTVDLSETSGNNDVVKGDTIYRYPTPLADSIAVGVHAVDKNGCIFDSIAYVYKWQEIWAPDAFSPNGDEINDRFIFRGGRFVTEFHVTIYDRLGGIVYEGGIDDLVKNYVDDIKDLPSEIGWDGTYKGKPCPWGVYGYTITYKSSQTKNAKSGKIRGSVTLTR